MSVSLSSVDGQRSGEPAVKCRGVSRHFGQTKALDGLDLAVDRGQVVGLLGPNGAGKTTTVNILSTLLLPTSGSATVDGFDVVTQPREVRSRIGLTGQFSAVAELLTGYENLEMAGRLYHLKAKEARARASELLERLELTEAANRPAKGYSGGMMRRLDIAMSLVARPPVLFLDEPTTGLDPSSRRRMWDLIEELVEEGTTTLLTTQYLEEADVLADEIVVIDQGRVIAEGTPESLKSQFGASRLEVKITRTENLQAAADLLSRAFGGQCLTNEVENLVSLPVADVDGVVVKAVRLLDDDGLAPLDIGLRRPTLDDVFLELTGHTTQDPSGLTSAPSSPAGDQR